MVKNTVLHSNTPVEDGKKTVFELSKEKHPNTTQPEQETFVFTSKYEWTSLSSTTDSH